MMDGTRAMRAKSANFDRVPHVPTQGVAVSKTAGAIWRSPFLEIRRSETASTAKYTSGATITMLVILMRNDSESAMAATKNDDDSLCSTYRRRRQNPTIAKLSDGTSGMNDRPAKIFTGAKL